MTTTTDGGPLKALKSGFAWAAKRSFHSGAAGSASSDDQTIFSCYVQQYLSGILAFLTTGGSFTTSSLDVALALLCERGEVGTAGP
jgi:hypothetical protein